MRQLCLSYIVASAHPHTGTSWELCISCTLTMITGEPWIIDLQAVCFKCIKTLVRNFCLLLQHIETCQLIPLCDADEVSDDERQFVSHKTSRCAWLFIDSAWLCYSAPCFCKNHISTCRNNWQSSSEDPQDLFLGETNHFVEPNTVLVTEDTGQMKPSLKLHNAYMRANWPT